MSSPLMQRYRRFLHGRALVFVVLVVVAVIVVVIVIASGGSDSSDTAGSSVTSSSTATTVSSAVASSTAPTTTPSPIATAGSVVVTIAGQVRQVLANGNFVVNDGKVDYTVTMSSTTKVVDLNGAEASPDGIQVDGSAQITGLLSGTTISADSVTIPTPATDTPATT